METILFKNVTKRYNSIIANNELSFSVGKGEIFGLLGPNGSGKTTAIKLLTGLLYPDKGEIKILGKDPGKHWKSLRYSFGLVPQETPLYPELNAIQYLQFTASLYIKDFKNIKKTIDKILDLVELKDRAKDRISTYSGGMKRRLSIGRVLLHNPEIILLDEPTLGVDVQGSHRIWDYIKSFAKAGKTVLVTTNVMSEADYLCSRLLIIDHGKNIAQGTPNELKESLGQKEITVKKRPSLDDVFLHYTGRSLRD
jgi:ABC-2 type transport system ATP-binding protein